jgi:hypothetical protein
MFRASSFHLQEALHYQFWFTLPAVVDEGKLQLATCHLLQRQATFIKTASVVPPEDGSLTLETCRGFKTQ